MTSVDLEYDTYVPVSVDAERVVDDVPMLRATYFVVTADVPSSVWEIELPPLARLHGLGALGMLGVVFGALREVETPGMERTYFDIFSSADDVAAIFELEQEGKLSIQLEDLWIPTIWCEDAPVWGGFEGFFEDVARGEVFRLADELFQQAYRFGVGDITVEQLLELNTSDLVYRSPTETAALQGWAENQIELTRRAFPNKEIRLRVRYE